MRLQATGIDVEVRPATPADVPSLLGLIRRLAVVERLTVTATEDSLREALFGERRDANALLVFDGHTPVGYAIYFFTFASMAARRGLWLDDLFVDEAYRGRGIGRAMLGHLARIALDNACARFEWIVLDWNEPAVEFYRRMGATMLPDWRVCRLEGAHLESVGGCTESEATERA